MTALLAGLLTGGLIVSGATPVVARPDDPDRRATTLSVRLAPPVVTTGEPAALVAQLPPAQSGRPVEVQRLNQGGWDRLADATLDATGRAVVALDTAAPSDQVLRVTAEAWNGKAAVRSPQVTLRTRSSQSCTPKYKLVDPAANDAAKCLAARLDRWKAAGLMGVGQQLNVSSSDFLDPLTALAPQRVNVVGFDLWELAKTGSYEFPFLDRAVADLSALALDGAVLSVSWHADNPHTGGNYADRGWHDLGALLDPLSAEYIRFWSDYSEKLELLRMFQDNGVAVVFRPFHEANGGWFWWGHAEPSTYRKVWAEMQRRAQESGLHNIVWAYSFAAKTWSGVAAPESLVPAKVDLAGIDSYDPEATSADAKDRLDVTGYAAVARKVRRMAFTEVGPERSEDGAWNPAVITRTARTLAAKPIWAMLWFDDSQGDKQISSLQGGPAWLKGCANAFCQVG
ncbi:hypothetical protein GCM10023146_03430 [Nocardioides caricicola]